MPKLNKIRNHIQTLPQANNLPSTFSVIKLQIYVTNLTEDILISMQNIAPEFPFHGYDWSNAQFKGEGSFGKVYKVLRLQNNEEVAVKQIDMTKIDNQYLLDSLINQMKIMKEVESPNTVRLYDSDIGQNYSYMILQLCDSDLRQKMENSDQMFSEAQCLQIFSEIVKGMKVLVEHSYLHRDIKPANVLIRNNVYKIADYGFARKADFYGMSRLDEICGTPIYMAPQLLCNETYTIKCDIWSLGLMLYEIIFGCPPWPVRNIESYTEAIRTRPLSFPYNIAIGRETKDFLIKALTVNEDYRMNWDQLFNHQIIKSRNSGENVEVKEINSDIIKILSRMQYEVEVKQIDLFSIFKKYEQFQTLNKNHFFALLFEISPATTTYQSNSLFEFCDANHNESVQFKQFRELFSTHNYHENPVLTHNLQQLICLIEVKKLDPQILFNSFDKNNTGALDHEEFKNFLQQIGPRYDQRFIQEMYKIFDKDGTGLIDKQQFISTITVSMKNTGKIDIQRAKRNAQGLKTYLNANNISGQKFLSYCDKDKDSHISLNQFLEVMKEISYGISEEEAKWIFSCIDSNNSGSINIDQIFRFIHI